MLPSSVFNSLVTKYILRAHKQEPDLDTCSWGLKPSFTTYNVSLGLLSFLCLKFLTDKNSGSCRDSVNGRIQPTQNDAWHRVNALLAAAMTAIVTIIIILGYIPKYRITRSKRKYTSNFDRCCQNGLYQGSTNLHSQQ